MKRWTSRVSGKTAPEDENQDNQYQQTSATEFHACDKQFIEQRQRQNRSNR